MLLVELSPPNLSCGVIENPLSRGIIKIKKRFKKYKRTVLYMDIAEVGGQIQTLRKLKGLTQAELGERLGVTFQSVSKWERGETLPDTALLPDLANVLETSIDNLLMGGRCARHYRRKVTMGEVIEAIGCFSRVGELLGKDNDFYIGAIDGINARMNMDMDAYLGEPYTREALIAEAAMQCINNGAYIDLSDIEKGFTYERWADIVKEYAKKYGLV